VSDHARILVIDDAEVNRALTGRQLKKLGFEVDLAESGAAALDLLCRNSYAMILVDRWMPGMDGFTFAALLREREAGASGRTPVIMVTAEQPTGADAARVEREVDGLLLKPISLAQLTAVLPPRAAGRPMPPSGAAVSAGHPPIDLAALAGLMGESRLETLRPIVGHFCRVFPGVAERLGTSAVARDRDSLAAAAHTAKGTASTVGATQLAEQMARLVDLAPTGGWPDIDSLVDEARREFRRVQAFAEAMPKD
jgi:CheY-like chemotaxis protein